MAQELRGKSNLFESRSAFFKLGRLLYVVYTVEKVSPGDVNVYVLTKTLSVIREAIWYEKIWMVQAIRVVLIFEVIRDALDKIFFKCLVPL